MTKKDKKIIEDSETKGIPIFVFTAKDKLSPDTIATYRLGCEKNGCNKTHLDGIEVRLEEFTNWQKQNPNQVKLPD